MMPISLRMAATTCVSLGVDFPGGLELIGAVDVVELMVVDKGAALVAVVTVAAAVALSEVTFMTAEFEFAASASAAAAALRLAAMVLGLSFIAAIAVNSPPISGATTVTPTVKRPSTAVYKTARAASVNHLEIS